MIDNLRGLAAVFDHFRRVYSVEAITDLASRLCHADMGAAAVQRYMSEEYHNTVAEARRWLRTHADSLEVAQ